MANRTRENELKVFLSDDEMLILNEKYKAAHIRSRSSFIRMLILYGFVYNIDYSHLSKYNENLGRISNSLNHIARRMNAAGNVYDEDVREVKQIMEEVWRTQKAMLRRQPLVKLGIEQKRKDD